MARPNGSDDDAYPAKLLGSADAVFCRFVIKPNLCSGYITGLRLVGISSKGEPL